ncbi:hypothetical protein KP509_25G077200 [Ceratopteris richardii]|uniref:Las1-like family protein n=1 Tax=Ceratopteris richardii TaxID=49495 RepID=A0A8T2RTY7_CERRI|nr:hypothetical protein KP509_25G077200 [Ceratopteris richardii]
MVCTGTMSSEMGAGVYGALTDGRLELRAHDDARLVPWESWELWNEVRERAFSSSPEHVSAAIDKITAWRARNCLPVAVEVTWNLLSIQRSDPYFLGKFHPEKCVSHEMLRLMYSMTIMRLINGVVDHSRKQSSSSVAYRAEVAGLPRTLVDIRHEVAHQELPSLSYLQISSKEALEWLKLHYWEAQKQLLDIARNNLPEKLEAYLRRKGNHRRKLLALHVEKLVKLHSPSVTFPEREESSNTRTDELRKDDAEDGRSVDYACQENSVDVILHESESVLASARKRLQLMNKGYYALQPYDINMDVDSLVDVLARTTDADHFNGEKSVKRQVPSNPTWKIVDSWKPCAIGMLPSKFHRAGILPYWGRMLSSVSDGNTLQVSSVQESKLSEGSSNLTMKKTTQNLVETEANTLKFNPHFERNTFTENKSGRVPVKKSKTEDKAVFKMQKQSDSILQDVPVKDYQLVQDAPEFSADIAPSFPAGEFLLVDGIYQRFTASQLAKIRSSIQILK